MQHFVVPAVVYEIRAVTPGPPGIGDGTATAVITPVVRPLRRVHLAAAPPSRSTRRIVLVRRRRRSTAVIRSVLSTAVAVVIQPVDCRAVVSALLSGSCIGLAPDRVIVAIRAASMWKAVSGRVGRANEVEYSS